jgi:hypothetical protein
MMRPALVPLTMSKRSGCWRRPDLLERRHEDAARIGRFLYQMAKRIAWRHREAQRAT